MGVTHNKIRLTNQERRALAVLEDRAIIDDSGLDRALRAGLGAGPLRWSRAQDLATALMFLLGAGVMLATFTRWPVAALSGLVVQVAAVWAGLARIGELVGSRARRWARQQPTTLSKRLGPG